MIVCERWVAKLDGRLCVGKVLWIRIQTFRVKIIKWAVYAENQLALLTVKKYETEISQNYTPVKDEKVLLLESTAVFLN